MSSFVHNLKKKPIDVKNRIAIFAAISVTFVIVGIWLLVVRNSKTDKDVADRSAGEDLKPLMMIFGGAKDGLNKVKTNIKNSKQEN